MWEIVSKFVAFLENLNFKQGAILWLIYVLFYGLKPKALFEIQ